MIINRTVLKLHLLTAFAVMLYTCPLFAAETKKADLAGSWYTADAKELSAQLESFIEKANPPQIKGHIMGLISPHAGYDYSGPVAGFGFKNVKGKGYNTVVILGFSHRKFFEGVSVYEKGIFSTPLGNIEVDSSFAKKLIDPTRSISYYPRLFEDENSVEMMIPFIQTALPEAKIVPVAFGTQDYLLCEVFADILARAIGGRSDILVIASTDMSHFHSYEEANKIDDFCIRAIKRFDAKALYDETRLGTAELCGAMPVTALLLTMKKLGAENIEILKYANSGDVTGDKMRVVGYLAAAFYKPTTNDQRLMTNIERKGDMLNEKQRKHLLEIARKTMEEYVKTGKRPEFTETDPELLKEKGAFVTLHYRGSLRGCIGNIIGRGPLYKTVRDMAIESSTSDPRFPPVEPAELKDIKIEISVLSEPERVTDPNKLIMGKHGVIVKRGFNSGVFLPQVADETGWSREEFLSNLCSHKAGLRPDAWKDPATELYSFTAEVFGEE